MYYINQGVKNGVGLYKAYAMDKGKKVGYIAGVTHKGELSICEIETFRGGYYSGKYGVPPKGTARKMIQSLITKTKSKKVIASGVGSPEARNFWEHMGIKYR